MTRWFKVLRIEKFTMITSVLASRWRCLDDFVDQVANGMKWTQRMSRMLCDYVPKDQVAPVDPYMYLTISSRL